MAKVAPIKVAVAKIPVKKTSKRELYATVCYYYPQYKLQEVQEMPAKNVFLLIKIAQKMEGMRMLNLTQIAAAPHTKKGVGVKKLMEAFKVMANNG